MSTEEKIEVLIKNISAANINSARTDSHLETLHDFEVKITTYNVSSLVTAVFIEDTTELNAIVNKIIEELNHLSFNYIVKDYRIHGIEKGYMYIHYPTL